MSVSGNWMFSLLVFHNASHWNSLFALVHGICMFQSGRSFPSQKLRLPNVTKDLSSNRMLPAEVRSFSVYSTGGGSRQRFVCLVGEKINKFVYEAGFVFRCNWAKG